MPFWLTRPGAPARQYSSSKISHSVREASRPPYSAGQFTTAQPASYSVRSQSWWARKPAGVSIEGRGSRGTWAASQRRISRRNSASAALKARSVTRASIT